MNTALCLSIGLCWFRLGFPTSCLHRHVGAPTGLNPKILLHAIMKIFWIFVEQGKIMAAEAPTVPVDATPTETNSAPTSQPPPHITPDAIPAALPSQFILAGDRHRFMLACIPGRTD